jgi:hypothetical protein
MAFGDASTVYPAGSVGYFSKTENVWNIYGPAPVGYFDTDGVWHGAAPAIPAPAADVFSPATDQPPPTPQPAALTETAPVQAPAVIDAVSRFIKTTRPQEPEMALLGGFLDLPIGFVLLGKEAKLPAGVTDGGEQKSATTPVWKKTWFWGSVAGVIGAGVIVWAVAR